MYIADVMYIAGHSTHIVLDLSWLCPFWGEILKWMPTFRHSYWRWSRIGDLWLNPDSSSSIWVKSHATNAWKWVETSASISKFRSEVSLIFTVIWFLEPWIILFHIYLLLLTVLNVFVVLTVLNVFVVIDSSHLLLLTVLDEFAVIDLGLDKEGTFLSHSSLFIYFIHYYTIQMFL